MLRVPATDRAYASGSSILEPRGGGVGDVGDRHREDSRHGESSTITGRIHCSAEFFRVVPLMLQQANSQNRATTLSPNVLGKISSAPVEKVSDYGAELLNSIRGLEPAREHKTLPCWSAHGGWLAWQLQSGSHFSQLAAGNMEHLQVLIYIVTDIEVVALRAVDNALR